MSDSVSLAEYSHMRGQVVKRRRFEDLYCSVLLDELLPGVQYPLRYVTSSE